MIHERTISVTFFHFTEPGSFFSPAPMIAPVETCVVETGKLFHDARKTSVAVVRLAVSDSGSGRGVSLRASVSSPLRPEINPPAAIAIVTITKPIDDRFGNAT